MSFLPSFLLRSDHLSRKRSGLFLLSKKKESSLQFLFLTSSKDERKKTSFSLSFSLCQPLSSKRYFPVSYTKKEILASARSTGYRDSLLFSNVTANRTRHLRAISNDSKKKKKNEFQTSKQCRCVPNINFSVVKKEIATSRLS